jgi:hypothetical protein
VSHISTIMKCLLIICLALVVLAASCADAPTGGEFKPVTVYKYEDAEEGVVCYYIRSTASTAGPAGIAMSCLYRK